MYMFTNYTNMVERQKLCAESEKKTQAVNSMRLHFLATYYEIKRNWMKEPY